MILYLQQTLVEGAITHITALRDFNNETRCILAVGQDSSLDVGRNTTQNCDKQACVNIIELYANNKKKWLFIIRPNKLNEMCEITSMRLIPATVGYSVIIAFRAISGNASEIVRHTISSSHDGQLDLEVTIPGSERLLDAYPFKDTCLALTQRRLVQNPNDSNVSWNDRLLLFDSCGNVEITDKITGSKQGGFSNMGSLTVATTNQYSRGSSVESQSQATTDYDSTASAVSVELGDTQGSQSGFNTQDMLPRDDAGDIAALEQQLDYVQEVTNAAPDEILTGDEHLSQETVLGESFQQVVEQGMITTEATHVDERQQTAICEIPTVTETPQSETHGADSGPYNEMAIDMEEQDELMEDEEGTIASAKDESQGGLLENDTTEGEFVDEALIYHQSETHLMEVENDKAITTSKYPDYEAELQIVPSITAEPTSDTSISSEDEERCPRMTEKRRGDVDASPDTSGTEESEPRAICEQQLSDLEQDGSELALEEDKSDSKIEPESQSVVPAALNDRFPMPLVEEQAALSLPHSLPFSAHFIQKAPSPPSLPQPQQKLLPCQQKQEPHTSPSHTLTSADNSTVWSTFATTTPSSSTTSSSKMLPAFDYDSTSPSPLRLSDEDHRSLSSPYVHVPMPIQEETETSSQRQPDYDDSYNDYQNDDDYYDKSIVPVYSPTMTQQKQQQQQLPIRRHEAVNEQLFIDLILQELLGHEYNKNYPNLSDKFSLLLARPADKQQPNYQAHTFARYYSSLRDSGDAVTSTSLIHISEADANLVTAYWLFDRCEYTRALTYLQSEKCSSSSYDFKIMKTLEKGLGVQKAHRCLEEIEATRGTDTAIFQPNSWVHFLRDISLESVFKYIKSTPRDMDIRNNLLVTVCKDLFQGSTVPSTQEIRDLAVFDHNEEQRQQLFSFAKSMETVASKTLLMYLHLKTNQRTQFGEAVILNRAIQATKPEAGLLVTDEEALYRRCQELEDLVYSHEPKNARHFLPEWYFFPPGQAKPPYDKLFRENRTKVGSMLMIDAMARKMAEATGSNKRPHREDDEEDGQEREDDCKKARRM
ncbi:hypothetical protein BDB00DRAFT_103963 [Zychaea mexicana]|uniref:uncharacterized protein n=1 Tax=Zychaea mexicana TaxID=64656 RepID=UPI0022FE92F7|nr:uncharacterized protein BDB00DRAFT_103963 [Zychaea mexicana]KAI9496698.1 hypothetical protein BDB00DRAFT_103963 [Zychaea mexicana]